jgi:hypothetical protein
VLLYVVAFKMMLDKNGISSVELSYDNGVIQLKLCDACIKRLKLVHADMFMFYQSYRWCVLARFYR